MLKLTKENTKQEKWIIISLWAIALYFIVGSLASIVGVVSGLYIGSLFSGVLLGAIGFGLILRKSWALQILAFFSLFIVVISLGVPILSFFEGKPIDYDGAMMNIIFFLFSGLFYFIAQHDVSKRLYQTELTFLHRVNTLIFWTLGLGVAGFIISFIYMVMFVDGVYRGFVIIYGTGLFLLLGLIIGGVKAFYLKSTSN